MSYVAPGINAPVLEQINSPSGRRYRDQAGVTFPSVTTVLGNLPGTDNSWLEEWRARVGAEQADKIMGQAGTRGSAIHDMAEKYLLKQDWKKKQMPVNLYTFRKLIPELDKISRIQALEMRMMSYVLQVGGTVDCVACYDGRPAVIDFKTSRWDKTADDIHSYFMQASIYSLAFEELTGIAVKRIVILMASDQSEEALVFEENRTRWLTEFIEKRVQMENWISP